jgi:hypothetical protein
MTCYNMFSIHYIIGNYDILDQVKYYLNNLFVKNFLYKLYYLYNLIFC